MKIFFIIWLAGLLLVLYAYIETYLVKINRITFTDADIPPAFSGKKIVFVADIHHGPFYSRSRVRKLVRKINALHPDLVIFGGDFVYGDTKYIEPCFEELKKVKAPLGKFGVLGNHDLWADADLVKRSMQNAGITYIDNKSLWISIGNQRIKIGGVADCTWSRPKLYPTVQDVKPENFVMVVTHNPDYAEIVKVNTIDLMLAGHMHGGQMRFYNLWTPYVPSAYGTKYRAGIVKTPYLTVIITTGIGTIGLPFRFFVRPEIIVITLQSQKHS